MHELRAAGVTSALRVSNELYTAARSGDLRQDKDDRLRPLGAELLVSSRRRELVQQRDTFW